MVERSESVRERVTRRALQALAKAAAIGLVASGLHCTAQGQGKPSGKSGGKPDAPVVPVTVIEVQKSDLPIYLEGLGTVTASATVTVKPQVDGPLVSVKFREGQDVKKGDVLAEIDPRPFKIQLDITQAAIARDAALLANAKTTYDRDIELAKNGLVTTQQVDDAHAAMNQAQGVEAVDAAQAENARLSLEYATVKSPIDGVTGVRVVDAGNIVHAADPNGIVVVTALDPIAVIFTLPEDDLAGVSKALAAGNVKVAAFARDGTTELGEGDLAVIDNEINVATATMRLKALFPNPKHQLWPNQFVKARLLLTTKKDVLTIPAVAVQRGPNGTLVYVIGDDSKAEARSITVDQITGETALVSAGLEKGEKVVIDGQAQIKPGAKVSAHGAGENGKGDKSDGVASPDASAKPHHKGTE